MLDDLPAELLDPDLLDALAELDAGGGTLAAHDVAVVNSILGPAFDDLQIETLELDPELADALDAALGPSPVAGGSTLVVDPFGVNGNDLAIDADTGSIDVDSADVAYTDAQEAFCQAGLATPTGFAFLPEIDQAHAFYVPPFPGEYVLDTHGTQSSVIVDGAELDASAFAQVVAQETDWNGEPIRLFSCSTGQDADGFAQQLADQLEVTVTAPTEVVWSSADGSVHIGEPEYDPLTGGWYFPDPPSGEWATFTPQTA
jgi:hypothetical protein